MEPTEPPATTLMANTKPATPPAITSNRPIMISTATHNVDGAVELNEAELAAPNPASTPTNNINMRGNLMPASHGVAISMRCTGERAMLLRRGCAASKPATKIMITRNHNMMFAASSLLIVEIETTLSLPKLSAVAEFNAPARFIVSTVPSTTKIPCANTISAPSTVFPTN